MQDNDGVIYIGNTSDGVLIYDGQRISKVLSNNGKPKTGLARALLLDSHNDIYTSIGNFEFGYIEKNNFGESIYHSLSDKLNKKDALNSGIWGLAIHHDTVFIQSEKAVYLYKYRKLLKVIHFNNITHILTETPDGVFLRVWDMGLSKYQNGEFKIIPSTKDLFAKNRVDGVYLLQNGDHLLVSRNVGLWLLKPDGSLVKAKSDIIDDYAKNGESYFGDRVLKNGYIPMTTGYRGLVFMDQNLNLVSVLNKKNGIEDEHISFYTQDRVGDIWAATTSEIFKSSFDTSLTYYSTINGISGSVDFINRINGKIYIRSSNDLYSLEPKNKIEDIVTFKTHGLNELGSDVITFGNQIITTNNYTVKSTLNGRTSIVSKIYRSTQSIQSKLNPRLLFTSNYAYGLLVNEFKNGKWNSVTLAGQDTIKCFSLSEPIPGNIIIVSLNGIYNYQYDITGKGTYTRLTRDKKFTTKDFLKITALNGGEYVLSDSLDNFYKIDLKANKLVYTGFNLSTITNNEQWGYHYNRASGHGWIITVNGLYKLKYDARSGFTFVKYPFYKVDLNELSTSAIFSEGFGDNEIVWLGSQDNKLYRFIPEVANKVKQQNYTALIRSIHYNNEKISLNNPILPFNKNNLTFDVSYPVFGNESKTTFSFWLEGQDNDWSNYVKDIKKEYTNLHEGKYIFHVKAKDASGQVSLEQKISFTILPPWYRSIFAYLLYLIFLIFSFIQFGKYQSRKSFQKAENERKNSELTAAKDLQNRLLPKHLPNISNLEIAGYLRTSTEVGGDYYDFFEQKDGALYAICGDATGHGTPSGMLVSITKAGLIGLPRLEPNLMLKELNKIVKKVDLGILRMSLNIAYIKDNELILSSAGMPPYFIYRATKNQTEEIMISGVPLGSFNNVDFDQIKTTFEKGDILAIISDGLPEAPNLVGEQLDYAKVQTIINENNQLSPQEIIDKLLNEADNWLEGQHNPDDITIVVIKYK